MARPAAQVLLGATVVFAAGGCPHPHRSGVRSIGTCDFASLGLGAARNVTYRPPDGCSPPQAGAPPIRDEAAFRTAFGCTRASGVDFGRHEIRTEPIDWSPATAGVDVLDDGRTITFVTSERGACPGEGEPMPIRLPVAYLVPAGATRASAHASCTVDVHCW